MSVVIVEKLLVCEITGYLVCDGVCDEVSDPEAVLYHHSIGLQGRLPAQQHRECCVVIYGEVAGRRHGP